MDICLCASMDCVRRPTCLRATVYDKADSPGIYTMSYLGEDCNEKSDYEAYIYDDRKERKNGRSKKSR